MPDFVNDGFADLLGDLIARGEAAFVRPLEDGDDIRVSALEITVVALGEGHAAIQAQNLPAVACARRIGPPRPAFVAPRRWARRQ